MVVNMDCVSILGTVQLMDRSIAKNILLYP
jgi:hypothetical protein